MAIYKDNFSKARKRKTSLIPQGEKKSKFFSTCHFPISVYCDACNCVNIMSEHVRRALFTRLHFMSSEPKLPSCFHTILMLL